MKLQRLEVEGFGRLVDRAVDFGPQLTIVYGPNEAGKSSLTSAIVATLYGVGREKEAWRPWTGARYAARLRYSLDDGREFELQRDFERDPKGMHAYDRNGNDVTTDVAGGKTATPGLTHLGIPLEVFVNASCARQALLPIDVSRAEKISTALAHALDGGPKEDAALGAIKRLDDAIAIHVGTKRATVNNPLRHAQETCDEMEVRAADARRRLAELGELRERMNVAGARADELTAVIAEHERRLQALRAHLIRQRLTKLKNLRDDLAALQAQRAHYDDVASFPSERVGDLETLHQTLLGLQSQAAATAAEALTLQLTPGLESELAERRHDGGALSDEQFATLEESGHKIAEARTQASNAEHRAITARRDAERGSALLGAAIATGIFGAAAAAVFAALHFWLPAAIVGLSALSLFTLSAARLAVRRHRNRAAVQLQRAADDAIALEARVAAEVAATLAPLGVATIEELAARRRRAIELQRRQAAASHAAARATGAAERATRAAAEFDSLARRLVPPQGSRELELGEAKKRRERRIARDGIDAQLHMLAVRRDVALAGEDEFALERELEALLVTGMGSADPADGVSERNLQAIIVEYGRQLRTARELVVACDAEIRATEAQIGDVAALDEEVERLRRAAAHLQQFESVIALARQAIDVRTKEAHQKFARRLEDYSQHMLETITGLRYSEIRLDPTTLAIRVRVPETNAIIELDQLSTGTRAQVYLIVRLAMARMFGEGLEPTPLLLDDPFAFWDDERIARGLPVLGAFAEHNQAIVFTTSRELADAASQSGAQRIDLTVASAPVPV